MADIDKKLVAVWGLQGNCTSCTWYHQCTSTLREGTRTGVRKTKQTQCCHLNSITNWEKTNPLFDNFFYEKFREKSKDYLKKPGWRTVQNSVGQLLHWYYLTVVLTVLELVLTVLAMVPTTLTLVLVALALIHTDSTCTRTGGTGTCTGSTGTDQKGPVYDVGSNTMPMRFMRVSSGLHCSTVGTLWCPTSSFGQQYLICGFEQPPGVIY